MTVWPAVRVLLQCYHVAGFWSSNTQRDHRELMKWNREQKQKLGAAQ